ncbi:protein kintoun isoform X2 [Trachypithecus francoisi]|uniref:protein kintoun isoform X2 n=1 Tax=Trachypithecus francoisi TaxID=54180 RepID=UPI00141B68CA|nr:protein kintoun isoform X2 [Trachypithecus francoisi]
MAKAEASSSLEDLDLSGEEVQQLTSAFQDPEFRRMFSQYAEELTDPENRRRYEAEITALERERGVEVRFVHPQPGHVLRTSLDGTRRCFVNVCSNALVGAPSSRPGSDDDPGAAPGSHWSLPYSLAPGREYAGRSSSRYMVYDVVFHPDALALARRHEGFRQMLDATALEAVEKQFGVKLDRRNAKTLKAKYKGTPEAAVLRTPLPGVILARPEGEPKGPLPDFPYPYQYPATAENSATPGPRTPCPPEAALQPAPTEPRYSVVQRHHVDLQDYRCSRDSAPSPVPQELVVTIELPLLRSAEQAALEVTGKLLCLDSRKPDYRLRLSLPYPVDDGRGKAQFNKARRQLVVTLPVVLPAARWDPAVAGSVAAAAAPEESLDPSGTDGQACASVREGEAGLAGRRAEDEGRDTCVAGAASSGVTTVGDPEVASPPAGAGEERVPKPEEQDLSRHAGSPPGSVEEPSPGGENSPGGGGSLCTSCRGLAWESYAGRESARGDTGVETREESEGKRCERSARAMGGPGTKSGEPLCPPLLCNQDKETLTLLIQVPQIQPQSLQGDLNPLWYKLRFSTQDLVYSFFLQFAPENKLSTTEPVISISSNNAVIELAKSPESHGHWREWYYGVNNDSLELQECGNSDQLQGKEERVNEESSLTEKEYIEHCNTSTTDSDSSIAVKALQIDSFGSVTCFQQESLDVSKMILGKSQQPESKEKSATCSNEEKGNLNESVVTEEKETDGDHLPSLLNKTTVHNIPGFDSIKETNMQDGSVQVIKDHVTNCAFSFQNSLLYDLD